ncbi:MAG: MFS transporter [Pseudoclavibacter sp.]|nr:MFS transporter [Pseudoclavibacter sp.]
MPRTRLPGTRPPAARFGPLAAVVGVLALVELTSGILQGYYTPMLSDLARHLRVHDADVNWLEGAQLMCSALVVPVLAKLGDALGHKRILLVATAVTALASFALAATQSFPLFLLAWALQGFYTVWLPLEIALVWSRATRVHGAERPAALTRRAAGLLVAVLELGVIAGALLGGQLVDALPMQLVLLVPAVAVALCLPVVWFGVEETRGRRPGPFDAAGTALLLTSLLLVTGGLALLRLHGAASPWPWAAVAAGLVLLVPFARAELRHPSPLVDVRMFRDPALWPVFLTAGLFGVSVLGAQAPLSTFVRTDPALVGYGLGASSGQTSLVIGAYVLSLVVGAALLPAATRLMAPRRALMAACLLVAAGYLLFLPSHSSMAAVVGNMVIAGVGSGALVAALPAAAAAAAPAAQTGVATGLTNSVKTVGGAVASAVFGMALLAGAAGAVETTAGSFAGYLTVWGVCGGTALASAVCLLFVPPGAFADREELAGTVPVRAA